jgi:hypothetical protein
MFQDTLMKFDPATGQPRPYPSHAKQWRLWHGHVVTAWLFNPWTGDRRSASDVGTDPQGHLILPPGEKMEAAGHCVRYGHRLMTRAEVAEYGTDLLRDPDSVRKPR